MQVVENGFGTQVMYGEKRGASTSLFVVKRVVFTQLSGLLPLFHFFFPLFVLSYSKFRKVEFFKSSLFSKKRKKKSNGSSDRHSKHFQDA